MSYLSILLVPSMFSENYVTGETKSGMLLLLVSLDVKKTWVMVADSQHILSVLVSCEMAVLAEARRHHLVEHNKMQVMVASVSCCLWFGHLQAHPLAM